MLLDVSKIFLVDSERVFHILPLAPDFFEKFPSGDKVHSKVLAHFELAGNAVANGENELFDGFKFLFGNKETNVVGDGANEVSGVLVLLSGSL